MTKWFLAPAALAILTISACAARDGGVPMNATELETRMRAFHDPHQAQAEAAPDVQPPAFEPVQWPIYSDFINAHFSAYHEAAANADDGTPQVGGAVVSANGGADFNADAQYPSFERAAELQASGKLRKARLMYTALLRDAETSDQSAQNLRALDAINREIFLSADQNGDMANYTIKPGDTLAKIAREHQTTWQFLRRINQLTKSTIFVGDTLLVPTARFTLEVNTITNEADLFYDGGFIKRYTLTGKADAPAGTYSVAGRLERHEGDADKAYVSLEGPAKITIQATDSPTSSTISLVSRDVTELFDLLPIASSVVVIG